MSNLICIKYIFCGFTLLRCSFTVHQLVERSQRCQMWLPFLPKAITDNLVFSYLLQTLCKELGVAWTRPGWEKLIALQGWGGCEIMGRGAPGDWHCCELWVMRVPQLSSNSTNSTQMCQGQFEHSLESPADWSNSMAQVLERWEFKVRLYPSHATNNLWLVTINGLFVLALCIM